MPDSTAGPWVRCLLCDGLVRSEHRHDMRFCGCGNLGVDGGADYLKLAVENGFETIEVQE